MKLKILLAIIFFQWLFQYNLWASPLADTAIHGFVSQGYLQSSENNFFSANTQDGTFEFNELALNINQNVADGLKLGIQFFARDFGEFGNDQIIIHWAYGDYFYRKWFGLRAGKMPIVLGFYNDTRDIDLLRVNVLLPQSVYPELLRDVFLGIKGIGCYGELPGNFSYQLSTGAMNLERDTSFTGIYRGYFSTDFDTIQMSDFVNGSLIWSTPIDNLRIGTTFIRSNLKTEGENLFVPQVGFLLFWMASKGIAPSHLDEVGGSLRSAYNRIDMEYNALTISLEYIWKNLTFAAEYSDFRNKYHIDSTYPLLGVNTDTLRTGGFYGSLSYRFTDWFEAGGYYSELYYDLDERKDAVHYLWGDILEDYGTILKETTFSMRFDLHANWLLKLEAHSMRGHYLQSPASDGKYHKNWLLYAAKVTFNF